MSNSREEIMEATFKALSEHGYASLSIQKIADESEKGKSSIYYHYEDKEDLMLAFLDFLGEKIRETQSELEEKPPEGKLDEMLDLSLGIRDDEQWGFQKALLEIRAQASHKESFAEKFREIDSHITGNVEETMREMNVQDPESTAEILVSCIEGAVNRKVSTGDREGLKELKEEIKEVVEGYVNGCENE